jgi:hypothetical protein
MKRDRPESPNSLLVGLRCDNCGADLSNLGLEVGVTPEQRERFKKVVLRYLDELPRIFSLEEGRSVCE